MAAFRWALEVRAALHGGLLQRGVPVVAGVAGHTPGSDAEDLLRRASAGLHRAVVERCPAWIERAEPATAAAA